MWLSIFIPILLTILVIVCVLLVLVVLMQRPRSEGLGAAFGSGMTENIFGAQTTTVLTKATTYLGCIFFGVTLLLTVLIARHSSERRVGLLENEIKDTKPLPSATVTPNATVVASPSVNPTSTSTPATTPLPSANPTASSTPATTTSPAPTSTAKTEEQIKPSTTPKEETSPVAASPTGTPEVPQPTPSATP